MESSARTTDVTGPAAGWRDVFMRAVRVAVVGFVVLQAKELIDAGMLDTKATAVDAALVAAGFLVLEALLKWAGPRR
jgi:hypothetical protein